MKTLLLFLPVVLLAGCAGVSQRERNQHYYNENALLQAKIKCSSQVVVARHGWKAADPDCLAKSGWTPERIAAHEELGEKIGPPRTGVAGPTAWTPTIRCTSYTYGPITSSSTTTYCR